MLAVRQASRRRKRRRRRKKRKKVAEMDIFLESQVLSPFSNPKALRLQMSPSLFHLKTLERFCVFHGGMWNEMWMKCVGRMS